MLKLIPQLIQIFLFFINLYREKDKEKAEEKKKVATKVVDAFKQTDKKERASRLNAAVHHINKLRK
jgi:hypothetical protein